MWDRGRSHKVKNTDWTLQSNHWIFLDYYQYMITCIKDLFRSKDKQVSSMGLKPFCGWSDSWNIPCFPFPPTISPHAGPAKCLIMSACWLMDSICGLWRTSGRGYWGICALYYSEWKKIPHTHILVHVTTLKYNTSRPHASRTQVTLEWH